MADGKGQREYPRAPLGEPVRFFDWGKAHDARAPEIGGGGLFVETDAPIAAGRILTLRVTLPTRGAFTVLGRVVRAAEAGRKGIGIRFLDLAARDRDAILDYVAGRVAQPA